MHGNRGTLARNGELPTHPLSPSPTCLISGAIQVDPSLSDHCLRADCESSETRGTSGHHPSAAKFQSRSGTRVGSIGKPAQIAGDRGTRRRPGECSWSFESAVEDA